MPAYSVFELHLRIGSFSVSVLVYDLRDSSVCFYFVGLGSENRENNIWMNLLKRGQI